MYLVMLQTARIKPYGKTSETVYLKKPWIDISYTTD